MTDSAHANRKILATNRKAFRDYFVDERLEAGLVLLGTEVKSLREGDVNLTGSFIRIVNGEAMLFGTNIKPYAFGNQFNHEPDRPRTLLLHRREIGRMKARQEQQGCALIPLSLYFRRGRAKLEIGICRGKQKSDKREALRKKETDREVARAMRQRQHTRT